MAANVATEEPQQTAKAPAAATEEEPSGPKPAETYDTPGKPSAAAWNAAMTKSWQEKQPPESAGVGLDRLRALAAGGDAVAACDLGILHLLGERGAPKSADRAAEWFAKSAKGGDARGATNYALLLGRGEGVAKDPVECMRWYRVAAESGQEGKIMDKHKLRTVA